MIALLTAALLYADGDTIRYPGGPLIRAVGYDAAERGTYEGKIAASIVHAAWEQGRLTLIPVLCPDGSQMVDKTRSRRPLAYFHLAGRDLGPIFIALGLAVEYNGGEPEGIC